MLPLLIYVLIARCLLAHLRTSLFRSLARSLTHYHALFSPLRFVLFLFRTHARTHDLKSTFFLLLLLRFLLRFFAVFCCVTLSHSTEVALALALDTTAAAALWLCWSPQFLLLRRRRHVVHFTEQIFALLVY